MKLIQVFIFFAIVINPILAQKRFGIEVRGSNSITYNAGRFIGSRKSIESYIDILKEENARHSAGSIGLIYVLNAKHLIKAHVGVHRNGRVIDIKIFGDDLGDQHVLRNLKESYEYLQFVPSYVYKISNGKFSLPLEAGISLNRNFNY